MDNYEPESVTGSVFHKLGDLPGADEGNMFGLGIQKTLKSKDSFGFIKMKNGATVFLESSWALNILESKEAAATLCGTKAGAQINAGMSYKTNELIINRSTNEHSDTGGIGDSGNIAFFEGSDECS